MTTAMPTIATMPRLELTAPRVTLRKMRLAAPGLEVARLL